MPLLKRSGLEKEVRKNYLPMSVLPFISKLVEKVVPRSVEDHVQNNDLRDSYQSAES